MQTATPNDLTDVEVAELLRAYTPQADDLYDVADMYEILASEDSTPTFLIDAMIHPWGTMLTGLEGSGKSTTVAHMTHALATGAAEWCGRRVNVDRPLRVMVMCTDIGSKRDYADKWRRFGGSANLHAMSLYGRIDFDRLIRTLRRRRIDLFVLDNLTGALDFEENGDVTSNDHARPIVGGLKRIWEAGVTPVLVHHTSDTGDDPKAKRRINRRALGAKRYSQVVRHEVTIDDPSHPEGSEQRIVTVHMSNHWRKGDATYLTFRTAPAQLAELGNDAIALDPEGADRATKRKRDQERVTRNRNQSIAEWVVAHCQGKNQGQTAGMVAETFDENVNTVITNLSKGRQYGALLIRERSGDKTVWRKKPSRKRPRRGARVQGLRPAA